VALTTKFWVTWHTTVQHSSSCTTNHIQSVKQLFVNGQTHGQTDKDQLYWVNSSKAKNGYTCKKTSKLYINQNTF